MSAPVRALLVEDSLDDAILVERSLRRSGLPVVTSRVDSEAALRSALSSSDWDVVLCDFDLPGFSGLQALGIVRELNTDVPFLFVSGTIGEEVAVGAMRAGAHDYVLKHHLQRLAPAIEREIREARMRRERQSAQAALRRSELRFQRVYESNLVGMAYWNEAGLIVEANDAFLRMVGCSRRDLELGAIDWQRVTPSAYAAADAVAAREIQLSGICRPYEKEFAHADGTRVAVLVTASRLDDGELTGVAMVVDISAERRAERERTEAHGLIAAMVESTPLPMIVLNEAEHVSLWNPAAAALFGWDASEAIGRRLPWAIATLDGEPLSLAGSVIARATKSSEVVTTVNRAGEPLVVELHFSPTMDADGQINGTALVVRDLTEKRKLEAQLRQAQKMEVVGNLASAMAHDFNNLLSVIALSVDLALDESVDRARLTADLHTARDAAYRGAGLTRQLLNFSRPSGVTTALVNLAAVVRDASPMLQRLIGQPNLRVEVRDSGEEIWVMADRGQLEQILLNLAINARDAMPGGGHLSVHVGHVPNADPPMAHILVRDTGMGIPPELLDQVCEPFFTTKEPGRGTGLGLSSVRDLVQQHGGVLSIESTIDVGTSITVRLPLFSSSRGQLEREDKISSATPAAVSTSAHDTSDATIESKPSAILVVDDDALIRRIAERLIRRLGHSVLTAASGPEALEVFSRASPPPRLVISDIEMPGMRGTELASLLRERLPEIPILFVSGAHGGGEMEAHLSRDKTGFLAKPYREHELTAAVERLIGPTPRLNQTATSAARAST